MTSRPIWMPLYVRDYLADTRHLTTLEHGAYLLLIMEYWQKGKLPTDDQNLRKICAMTYHSWKQHKLTLQAMFSGPEWRHHRIDQELKKAFELRLKRSVYGSKGGHSSSVRHGKRGAKIYEWNSTKS